LLADGRLPAGSYAHSGGLEPSVRAGRVTNAADLERFLIGRAETAGSDAAAVAAMACRLAPRADAATAFAELESEYEARMPSPRLRSVSRTLGRQLLRAMQAIHPHTYFAALGKTAHQPIVMGTAAAAFELTPRDAALAVLYENVTGPAAATAKVMAIDPFEVHAALARATARLDRIADTAAEYADGPMSELPADGAPLLDIAAERHHHLDIRLFAS
jgi:urease accessory protein